MLGCLLIPEHNQIQQPEHNQQPAKVNCWDVFEFNTTTCEWDNTGTQPDKPAKVNCWDVFEFNTTTCEWDNTGTQPDEPAKVNCWDVFEFNTTTCEWDNTGTQPDEPAVGMSLSSIQQHVNGIIPEHNQMSQQK